MQLYAQVAEYSAALEEAEAARAKVIEQLNAKHEAQLAAQHNAAQQQVGDITSYLPMSELPPVVPVCSIAVIAFLTSACLSGCAAADRTQSRHGGEPEPAGASH